MTAAKVAPSGMKCTPIEKKVNKTTIKLQHGDLTALPVDAWVLYAREDLDVGSGYGTAIMMRAGVVVKNSLAEIGPIKMGEAVISTAGDMAADKIIHAVGPKFQEADTEKKLHACMLSSLKVASENSIKTLAYPPMGSGFYGVPLDLCAKVMLEVITDFVQGDSNIEEIIICVVDYRDYVPFAKAMEEI
jgi:O-acetyl-ADP-ribose deacetylase